MLRITGKTLDVTTEQVQLAGRDPFTSTTISLLVGKAQVEHVRVGRDYQGALPKEGEEVTLHVVVSAYATRSGAGYRLTALGREGARPVSAVSNG